MNKKGKKEGFEMKVKPSYICQDCSQLYEEEVEGCKICGGSDIYEGEMGIIV